MDDLIKKTRQLRAQLEVDRGQWRTVAQKSRVPYKTIKNFMQRPESFPRVPTLTKLLAYYEKQAA
jgi:hypothetical protein